MNGEQGVIRGLIDRTWNPRSLSCDHGSASGGLDAPDDGSDAGEHTQHQCGEREYGDSNPNNQHDSHRSLSRDSADSIDHSVSDSERLERYSVVGKLPARLYASFERDNDGERSDFNLTLRLLDDTGATIGRYRGSLVKNDLTEAQYQQGFVNLFIVLGIALIMSAIGGKVSNLGAWMIGLVLVAFVLFEGVYYSKNKSFFTYGITQNKAGS